MRCAPGGGARAVCAGRRGGDQLPYRRQRGGGGWLPWLSLLLPALLTGCFETRLLVGDDPCPDGGVGPGCAGGAGGLQAWPAALALGEIPWDGSATATLRVINRDPVSRTVEWVEVLDDPRGELMTVAGEGGTGSLPIELPPGAPAVTDPLTVPHLALSLVWRPRRPGPLAATLRVHGDAPTGSLDVLVSGHATGSCLTVSPAALEFGAVELGAAQVQELVLTSCGDEDLVIEQLELLDDLTGELSLVTVPEGLQCTAGASRCTGRARVGAAQAARVVVRYAPADVGEDERRLLLRSNDPTRRELLVPLGGRGTGNRCPQAIAQVRPAGEEPWRLLGEAESRVVPPRTTIDLDGRPSTDSDGRIVAYRWLLAAAPGAASPRFPPSVQAPLVSYFLAVAGRYLFELEVIDDEGLPSCQPGKVAVEARPTTDLHVELTWTTPGDPDPLDTGRGAGSDLDLHLLLPRGQWFSAPLDCYFGNPTPDWGRLTRAEDDPALDRDDVDGWGPEVASLPQPREDGYRVGVHVYDDWGLGPSDATVRIFVDGLLRCEQSRSGLRRNQFWEALHLTWPDGPCTSLDLLHAEAPGGGPPK